MLEKLSEIKRQFEARDGLCVMGVEARKAFVAERKFNAFIPTARERDEILNLLAERLSSLRARQRADDRVTSAQEVIN